jgi:predicted anti-sigma-YlaC factor YlaD
LTSLRVDGELSELESALLDSHLRGCDRCRAFVHNVGAATAALRSAGAEEPAGPLALDLGGRPWRERLALQAVVLAAAIAASVVIGGLVGLGNLAAGGPGKPHPTAVVSAGDSTNSFRELRREQLLLQAHPVARNKLLPIGSV